MPTNFPHSKVYYLLTIFFAPRYATALVLTGVADRAALAGAPPGSKPDFVLTSLLSAVTGDGLERHA